MSELAIEEFEPDSHPIDIIEELAAANDWSHERHGADELTVDIGGRWGEHRLFFQWQDEYSAIQFCSRVDGLAAADTKCRPQLDTLLANINARLWLGHFDLATDELVPLFRHTLLLRGSSGLSTEQVEDVIEAALSEGDRFHPAFDMVARGLMEPDAAVEAALMDPVGEA